MNEILMQLPHCPTAHYIVFYKTTSFDLHFVLQNHWRQTSLCIVLPIN